MSRTKPNHRRVWGPRPLRTVGDRRKARPHGADARDYAAVFWVFKVPVGRILLSHVCFCFAPRTTQNLLGYPMIPPPQFPVFSSRCLFHSTLQTDSLRHAERRINSLQSITPVQFDKMFILSNQDVELGYRGRLLFAQERAFH